MHFHYPNFSLGVILILHLQIKFTKSKCWSSCMWPLCFCVCMHVFMCGSYVDVREYAGTSPCLAAGQSGMGLSLAVVVRLSQRYEACCFIGQAKLLRQGFCWRFELCQSQMELHNRFNPSGRMWIFLKTWIQWKMNCVDEVVWNVLFWKGSNCITYTVYTVQLNFELLVLVESCVWKYYGEILYILNYIFYLKFVSNFPLHKC